MTTFSVVIPTFNRAGTILECLESVFAQSRPADQIIVVDDGSIDETAEALRPLRGRIDYISQENQGVAVARNTGIAAATSDWIAFLDSDDIWYPNRLEVAEHDIDASDGTAGVHWANLRITGAGYDRDLFQEKSLSFPCTAGTKTYVDISVVLPGFQLQSMVCKRSWSNEVGGFFPWAKVSEDMPYATLLALRGPWLLNSEVVAEVRRVKGDQAALRQMENRTPAWTFAMKTRILDTLSNQELNRHDRLAIANSLSLNLFDYANAMHLEGRASEARDALIRSARVRGTAKGWVKAIVPIVAGSMGFRAMNARRRKFDRG